MKNLGIFKPPVEPNTFAVDKFNGNSVVNFEGYIPQNDSEVILYAIVAYGFIVKDGIARTFKEFANIIEKHYDKSNPQNAEVIRILNLY